MQRSFSSLLRPAEIQTDRRYTFVYDTDDGYERRFVGTCAQFEQHKRRVRNCLIERQKILLPAADE